MKRITKQELLTALNKGILEATDKGYISEYNGRSKRLFGIASAFRHVALALEFGDVHMIERCIVDAMSYK